MSDLGDKMTVEAEFTGQEAVTAVSAAVLPPPPAPRVEDAYAIVFDAICRDVLPKTPGFQHFVTEFMSEKKSLRETSAGRAVVETLKKDLAQPAPGGGPTPAWHRWNENQKRCKVFLALMGGHLSDMHESGQLPNAWPLAVADVEGSEQERGDSATVKDGEDATAEPETAAVFRPVTPDDSRLRLPTALDWLVWGIPARTPWGPRRLPFPIAGIFRGWV